jgi:hypothetical protein
VRLWTCWYYEVCNIVQKSPDQTSTVSRGGGAMALQWEPEWQRLYVEALLETDPLSVAARVAAAEKVMLLRVAELCTSSDEPEEWHAIEYAITGLSVLKREILKSSIGTKTEREAAVIWPRVSVG